MEYKERRPEKDKEDHTTFSDWQIVCFYPGRNA